MRSRFAFFLLTAGLGAVLLASPARGQIQPLPAPAGAHASFGTAVALSGGGDANSRSGKVATRALVGASGENACGENSGAAYVFEKNDEGRWQRAARLVPSDCEAGAFFGRSLALSGNRALVGASKEFFADERPNVAYVFEKNAQTGAWEEVTRLTVNPRRSEGTFAASVALDGGRALVTARGRLPDTRPARDAATSARPRRNGGAAYVFEKHPRTDRWRRTARLRPQRPDARRAFGGAGALDGDRLAVTASPYFGEGTGAVYVFEKRGAGGPSARWVQAAHLEGFDDFSIPLALEGKHLLVGESRAGDDREGAAVLLERTARGTWEKQRLRPRTSYRDGAFGTAVALGGEHALVTGYDEQLGLDFNIDRVAYVFERVGTEGRTRWRQRQLLDVGEVSFGTAVDVHGGRALVGHAPEKGAGAAYVIGLR